MRRRPSSIAFGMALCLTLTATFQPALAGGLIPTEQVAPGPAVTGGVAGAAAHRVVLLEALVAAGVDRAHAQGRLDALTDAEVATLQARYETAPAGGLWFAPILLVAMVIGALIGTRAQNTVGAPTDLFGRPRNMAAVP